MVWYNLKGHKQEINSIPTSRNIKKTKGGFTYENPGYYYLKTVFKVPPTFLGEPKVKNFVRYNMSYLPWFSKKG